MFSAPLVHWYFVLRPTQFPILDGTNTSMGRIGERAMACLHAALWFTCLLTHNSRMCAVLPLGHANQLPLLKL